MNKQWGLKKPHVSQVEGVYEESWVITFIVNTSPALQKKEWKYFHVFLIYEEVN